MEKREDIATALELIINHGIKFGSKNIRIRGNVLGDNLVILRNSDGRQQTIVLTKVSDGLILLQGTDVTIETVHMWFKRTQTALESAGIPAGSEILNDLKKRLEYLYVEGLFA